MSDCKLLSSFSSFTVVLCFWAILLKVSPLFTVYVLAARAGEANAEERIAAADNVAMPFFTIFLTSISCLTLSYQTNQTILYYIYVTN